MKRPFLFAGVLFSTLGLVFFQQAMAETAKVVPELVLQAGLSDFATAVAVSPDRSLIATAAWEGPAILWDLRTGRKLRSFGKNPNVHALAFSPDGKTLLLAGCDMTLWDVRTGRQLRQFQYSYTVESVRFVDEGRTIVTASKGGHVILWDSESGNQLKKLAGHDGPITVMDATPDGRMVVTGSHEQKAILWDSRTGEKLHTLIGQEDLITSVTLRADGGAVAAGYHDGTLVLWDAKTGEKIATFSRNGGRIDALAISQDGRVVTACSPNEPAVRYCIKTGTRMRTVESPRLHPSIIPHTAFTSDAQVAVVTMDDMERLTEKGNYNALVLDLATGEKLQVLTGCPDHGISTLSRDGTMIARGHGGEVGKLLFWDCSRGILSHVVDGEFPIGPVSWSSDGQAILVSEEYGNAMVFRDARTGKRVREWRTHSIEERVVQISPDWQTYVFAQGDTTALVRDVKSDRELQSLECPTPVGLRGVVSAAYSADSRLVAIGSQEGCTTLWEVDTGKKLHTFPGPGWSGKETPITSIAFSPDCKTLATGLSTRSFEDTAYGEVQIRCSSDVTLWDIKTGEKLQTLRGTSWTVGCVTFSPDGKIVAAGYTDQPVTLWDVKTGRKLRELTGDSDSIYQVGFLPAGSAVLTEAKDGSMKLWSVATGEVLLSCYSFGAGAEWLVTTPDGNFDGSPGAIRRVYYRVGEGLDVVSGKEFRETFHRPGLMAGVLKGEQKEVE